MDESTQRVKKLTGLGTLLLILIIPYALIYLMLRFLYGLVLHIVIWVFWISRGKSILIVTSDSPVWVEYMDEHIIGVLQPRAMILNWSKRKEWSRSFDLRVLAFYFFGGMREFNPLAVVFRPFRRAKVFRFWSAFKDYKHGKVELLEKITDDLLEYADVVERKAA